MRVDEYLKYDASGLADLIARGEVSAADVLETAIAQIERLNPSLNAVVTRMYDEARKFVPDAAAPLGGVPYLVKDLNTFCAGVPATNGSAALAQHVPQQDSELVARLRRAGLNIVGKTNTPEFGLNVCTSPALFGATVNPFDAQRSAGGSSGGSACAVASGMLPAAHATDSGGSVRIPASNCGLYGLKPTRARIPLGNDAAEGLAGFSTVHAVTHSVRDSALLMDLTHGPLIGDPYVAPPPETSFLHACARPPSGLRVGLSAQGFAGEAIHPDCVKAVTETAGLLEALGHHVEPVDVPVDGPGLQQAFGVLFSANIAALLKTLRPDGTWVSAPDFEPVTRACAVAASLYSSDEYARAVMALHAHARALGQFFGSYDLLLTPTLANPPMKLGELSMQGSSWDEYLAALLAQVPFTPLFNATGAPAASLPLASSSDGLPVGIQLGAAYGCEALLFAVSAQIEAARPWHQRQ